MLDPGSMTPIMAVSLVRQVNINILCSLSCKKNKRKSTDECKSEAVVVDAGNGWCFLPSRIRLSHSDFEYRSNWRNMMK
jgi:hypothetical protein